MRPMGQNRPTTGYNENCNFSIKVAIVPNLSTGGPTVYKEHTNKRRYKVKSATSVRKSLAWWNHLEELVYFYV